MRGVGFRRLNPHESQEIYLRAVRADWLKGRAEAIRRSLLLLLLDAMLTNGARFTGNGAIIVRDHVRAAPTAEPNRWAARFKPRANSEDRIRHMLSAPDKQQLDRALDVLRQVLNTEIVGAYLFGSAVRGGLRPESDLDILVVSDRATTMSEKEQLARGLMAISGRSTPKGIWRRVEVTVVVSSAITPWSYPPSLDFQYGDWLRTEFESGKFEPQPTPIRPDLALLITMVVAADTPVIGPPPARVFDLIPNEDVLKAMVADIDRLRGDIDTDTRNVILTLARMWSTFSTGDIRSKDAAASWVLDRLPVPQRPVLERARAAYLGNEPERWEDLHAAIGPCVDYMIARVKRLAAEGSV